MTCANCGIELPRNATICPECDYDVAPVQTKRGAPTQAGRGNALIQSRKFHIARIVLTTICMPLMMFYLISVAYYWFEAWQLSRIYDTGRFRAPVIEQLEMPFGQIGHSFTFFGTDGDILFLPNLNRTYPFVGGFTQIDVPDSNWFDADVEQQEGVNINIAPLIYTQNNGRINLPAIPLYLDAPTSPLTLIEPKADYLEVDTSMFMLRIMVVPGSDVLINGERQTSYVSHEGILEANLRVGYGETHVSVDVNTDFHKRTRRDLVLYRAPQTIPLERGMDLPKTTTKNTVNITGTTMPGANIIVDTKYVENSLKVAPTGAFSFRAQLSIIGDNIITWHAVMPGMQDQYASYTIYYVPGLPIYSGKAWGTIDNYAAMPNMLDHWEGQEFLSRAVVLDVFDEDGIEYIAVDAAPEGAEAPLILILENKSGFFGVEVGTRYDFYSDLRGTHFYGDGRYPRLTTRYVCERGGNKILTGGERGG